ncbi:hypothetical protein SAMN05660649_05124 [Desulfotomaculum arcticum]|uniref:Uncharacterized protein n=1 Tax=Desulfotruncus arcticus DSM 17038 TaxID=1121424 RepID=A0A1I2ZVD1_9FIRM|nr:hypothetical protein [Desulfotruncus arcticus]SFH41566.1 hypothetical protein SAMN05660649_05124 [Desulfotomaculum arcticum] [Desulfotruncus arcticus DSM 17038]
MLKATKLPPELISLVHHIELNKAGWWDKSIQRLILSVLWNSNNCLTTNKIIEELNSQFFINISLNQLESQISELEETNSILRHNGYIKIAEECLSKLENERNEIHNIEEATIRRFKEIILQHCPTIDIDELWSNFNNYLLMPLIREMGARTYEIISGNSPDIANITSFREFLNIYPKEHHKALRASVINFLDPKNNIVRKYILSHLNAYFLLEASNLSEETLKKLLSNSSSNPRFYVFADTNFLFSVLGLHENPFNEAANFLMSLTKSLTNKVNVNFFSLPTTIEETKKAISFNCDNLSKIIMAENLVAATIDTEAQLSYFARRYAEELKINANIRAYDFFYPYINNLTDLLKKNNIRLWNYDKNYFNNISTNQEIVDDILAQQEFEKKYFPDKAKSYENIQHDVILWHFVYGKREKIINSPLEAKFWVVTLDNRLLGFDRYKNKNQNQTLPLCVHPITLIQILQFWVTKTPEFEETVLNSFRWLFMSQEFDAEAEKITIRILEVLSRFENCNDLSVDVVKKILVDDALRGKIKCEKNLEKDVEFVKEALIEENKKIENKLNEVLTVIEEKDNLIEQIKEDKNDIETRLKEEQQMREHLENRLKNLEKTINHNNTIQNQKSARFRFVLNDIILSAIFMFLLSIIISFSSSKLTSFSFWDIQKMLSCIILALVIYRANSQGLNNDDINNWAIFLYISKFRTFIYTVLVGVIALFLKEEIATFIKHIYTKQ